MKRIMLIGKSGAGKTTLCQAIYEEQFVYQKTQTIQIIGTAIDTPGEYLEHRNYYNALMVTASDADVIVLVQEIGDKYSMYAPGFSGMFNKETVGVITKIDTICSKNFEEEANAAEIILKSAGCEKIFRISSIIGEGIVAFLEYLSDD